MATYLPQHEDFFRELINDSDSEGEFEGFNLEDIDEERNNTTGEDFLMDNWQVGDRDCVDMQFTGVPGVRVPLPDNPTALDFFKTFISDDQFEIMAEETNRYAQTYFNNNNNNIRPHSRFNKWVNTTPDEMKMFIALTIAMGVISQMDTSEYWTTDEINETPFFRKCMSRDRFWLLMSFFHLSDNSKQVRRGQPGHNPLYKLGNLYEHIVTRFYTVYTPHRQLSLDEGMVPWRGNLSFKVYNPDKPNKYGIKAYMLCDSTNGYTCKLKLYTGKSDIPASENGATYDLVMDMMRNYFGQGYVLYMDNYYSSPNLYWDLWVLGCGATGTLRQNRKGVPQIVKDKTMQTKGEKFVVHNKHLMLLKFNDRKVVHLLSTVDGCNDVPTGKQNPRTGEAVKRPEVIASYDKYMGGVDRADQMVSYVTYQARTLKWWKRVIFHVISLAVLNAYILYKSTTTDRTLLLHRQFRKNIVREIVESICTEALPASRCVGKPAVKDAAQPLLRLQGRHFPEKIEGTGKKKNITRACAVCSVAERKRLERVGEKRKRPGRESSYQCQICKKALCVGPCFRLYHSYKDFERAYISLMENEGGVN